MTKYPPIDWILAPVQTSPLQELRADWHFTLTNGYEISRGLLTNMTITDAFWTIAQQSKGEPGRWVGTLVQDGGGDMWAGHLPK